MQAFSTQEFISIHRSTWSMADEEQQGPPPPPAVGAESAGEWADARESVQHIGTRENAALRGASLSAFPSLFGSKAFQRRKTRGWCCRSNGLRRRRPGACVWTQRCLCARSCTVVASGGGPWCSSALCDVCAASLLHPRREGVEWCAHRGPRATGGGGLGSALQLPRCARLLAMRLEVRALRLSSSAAP